MTVLRPRFGSSALLAFIVTIEAVASAAPPTGSLPDPAPTDSSDKGMAEALFRAAKDLQAQGKLADACPKFAESHRLDPKPGTILNLASCHELEGRTASAWADYSEAATFAARAHQAEREKLARSKVEELGKRLSYVTFRFPDVKELTVLLDGKTLTTAAAGTRVPIDPGEHLLDARATGRTSWTGHVKIEAGPGEQTVVVPMLADETSAADLQRGPPAPPGVSSAGGEEPSPRDGSTQRAAGWITLGIGVAAVGAGTFFGLRTLSDKSTVDEHCAGSHCDDAGLRANDAAKDSATLSTIAFIVGGAVLATGIVLLVTTPRTRSVAAAW